MHRIGNADRATGYFGRRQQITAALIVLGLMCTPAGAQIDVNETGLHSGAVVYGVHVLAPVPPYLNEDAISVWAWGETNPDLYPYVGFSVYGLYSEPNLINTGAIGVNIRGGNTAVTDGQANAYIWGSNGIFTLGDANNVGDITITVMGGTAVAGDSYGADASVAQTGGVYARQGANNAGDITITATAGTATSSDGWAVADIWDTVGVYAEEDLYNTGDITITAAGGAANGLDGASAISFATGLFTEKDAHNAGTLSIMATGGSATADDAFDTGMVDATAHVYGIDTHGDIHNTGSVTAVASGGTATGHR